MNASSKYVLLVLSTTLCYTAMGQEKKQDRGSRDSVRIVADRDTVDVTIDKKKKRLEIIFEEGKKSIDDNLQQERRYGEQVDTEEDGNDFYGGLTFARFDIGLAKLMDHGSLSLSPENDFLSYKNWKSINVGFDVLKLGYKFNDQFRIYASAGFDWTHFRLKKDVVILENTTPLDYEEGSTAYRKNRFSSSYIRIPLSFEWSSRSDSFNDRFRISVGPIWGILIHGSQKFVSAQEGKNKNIDDYNYAPFRYGGFARIGYGGMGVYVKYYQNDMFVDSPAQEDLKNLSFGLTFLF